AIERMVATSGPPGGRSEMEYLSLMDVDESGRIVATVAFDPDDRRAASAEGFSRVLVGDSAAATLRPIYEFALGFDDHDPVRTRNAFADDLVVDDHRLVGPGLVEGGDSHLENIAALWRLAPDMHIDSRFELAYECHGAVWALKGIGTLPEGGAFERPLVMVSIVAGGRITRLEFFEPEDVDVALARFAELRPDPLRIPPNAATRTTDRGLDAVVAGDWEAVAATCARSLVFEDRRRLVRITGDRDMFIAAGKLAVSSGPRLARIVLATAGDRLALARLRWSSQGALAGGGMGIPGGGGARLGVGNPPATQGGAAGPPLALLRFGPDDRRAASAELLERYARSEAARCTPAAFFEALRAVNAHDLDRLRAVLPDDFAVNDH